MIRLLADCGNTCIKLGRAEHGRVVAWTRLAPDPAALAGWLAGHGDAAELRVCPGSRAHAALLRQVWEPLAAGRRWSAVGGDLPLPDCGQYPGCGADRVLAALAAVRLLGRDLVAVDCGTATTLGAWRVGPGRRPAFAGGLILPGARACLAGLHQLAPALPAVEPAAPDARADQRDTVGAIAAALGIGYGAMVAACIARLQRDSGCAGLAATGGAAGPLLDAGVLPAGSYLPGLVLDGLAGL